MKRFTTLCAGLGAMAFLGLGATGALLTAGCEERNNNATQVRTVAAETEWIQGMIESVNLEKNEFTLVVREQRADEEEKVTIRINEETQYFLDDDPASREDALQEDHRASVLHEDMLAVSVYAYSADPE